jgi:hypothetical protein
MASMLEETPQSQSTATHNATDSIAIQLNFFFSIVTLSIVTHGCRV